MNTKTFARISLLVLSASTFGGCAADADLASKRTVNTQTVDSAALTLGPPSVQQVGDTLQVTGHVRRPNFSPMHGGGHVHVQLVDAAGGPLQSTTALYSLPPGRQTPRTPGPRRANYHAELPGPLPEGGTVRVVACSETHPPAEPQE